MPIGHSAFRYARSFKRYWVQDVSFVTLLCMLGFTIFIMPVLLETYDWSPEVLHISLLLIFLAGIWSATSKWVLWLAVAFFMFSLILNGMVLFYSLTHLKQWLWLSYSLNTGLFVYTNLSLLFRDDKYNFHRVLGAVNVYLLFGLFGAFMLENIAFVFDASIAGNVELRSADEDFPQYIYYSMASLTTVGYGDVYAANAAARMLSAFLATLGILFPAVVIAKLVSVVSSEHGARKQNEP